MRLVASICVASVLLGACGPLLKGGILGKSTTKTNILDAPPDPKATMVEVPYVPSPAKGEGTLVINVVDGTAKASLVTSTKRSAVNIEGSGTVAGGAVQGVDLETKLLCAKTPCAVTLPLGSQTIHLEAPPSDGWDSSTDLYDVDVLPDKAQMITHEMSRTKAFSKPGKPAKGFLADILLESFGWSFAPIGAMFLAIPDGPKGLGAGFLIGGVAMILGGYLAYTPPTASYTETTSRPSATTLSSYPP